MEDDTHPQTQTQDQCSQPMTLRPNNDIVLDFDDNIPYRRRMRDGSVLFGRTTPPLHWEDHRILRSAGAIGAVFRNGDGELQVQVRSWIASTRDVLILPHRDFMIRAQLMNELETRIRMAWIDQIAPTDRITLTTVRPPPSIGYTGQRPIHVLIEINRPLGSVLHPVLLAHREIDATGPSDNIFWIPALLSTPVRLETFHAICAPPCAVHQLLVPQVGRV